MSSPPSQGGVRGGSALLKSGPPPNLPLKGGGMHAPPVGRPGGKVIIGRVISEVSLAATVSVHHVDLSVAIPVGGEGDLTPVKRPDGYVI